LTNLGFLLLILASDEYSASLNKLLVELRKSSCFGCILFVKSLLALLAKLNNLCGDSHLDATAKINVSRCRRMLPKFVAARMQTPVDTSPFDEATIDLLGLIMRSHHPC